MSELKVVLNKLDFRKVWDVCKAASIAESPVKVSRDDYYFEVDAKHLMNILSLGLRKGATLTFKSDDFDTLNKIRKILK